MFVNNSRLKAISGFGVTCPSKSTSMAMGICGVGVIDGVNVMEGVSVIEGVMEMLGAGVMVGIGVHVVVGDGVGEGGKN